jgi:uncharacterized membrane protein
MKLSEAGEARVRGYLFVLERSLRTFLPAATVTDAVREVESHLRERLDQTTPGPDERASLERVLTELGPPLTVAQAYSLEAVVDEAVTTGRVMAIGRALWQIAATTVSGFFGALGIFIGALIGMAFVSIAALKPIFPDNVGFKYRDGQLIGFGAMFPLEPGAVVVGGYWIVPVCLLIGLAILTVTYRGARRYVATFRERLARKQFPGSPVR